MNRAFSAGAPLHPTASASRAAEVTVAAISDRRTNPFPGLITRAKI